LHARFNPSELGYYESDEQIWKNQTREAKRDFVRKRQLDSSERDNWKITELGRKRLAEYEQTGKDPDEPQPLTLDPTAGD
jgi:hypothetical protein